jgi:DNA-binding response OmpR family regulator
METCSVGKSKSYEPRHGFMKGKTRILIVEDETPLACWMMSVLMHAGCDVETARTGKRAIDLASENRFDLITLDIKLPDTNGFEICRELRQRHISRRTPVIFISASSREEDMAEAKEKGAVEYITKPFEVTDFIYKVIYHAKAMSKTVSDMEANAHRIP